MASNIRRSVNIATDHILYRPVVRRWLDVQRAHDSHLHRHSLRVGATVAAYTRYLGYSQQAQAMSVEAAVLHDVGKIRISRRTLQKRGPLSTQEIQIMQCHPNIGVILLSQARACGLDVLEAIQQHHERLDGTGYPQGISGRSVCALARVLSICDVFAALTEARVYQGAYTQQEAVEVLMRNRGSLDTQLVESFARMAEKLSLVGADQNASFPGFISSRVDAAAVEKRRAPGC